MDIQYTKATNLTEVADDDGWTMVEKIDVIPDHYKKGNKGLWLSHIISPNGNIILPLTVQCNLLEHHDVSKPIYKILCWDRRAKSLIEIEDIYERAISIQVLCNNNVVIVGKTNVLLWDHVTKQVNRSHFSDIAINKSGLEAHTTHTYNNNVIITTECGRIYLLNCSDDFGKVTLIAELERSMRRGILNKPLLFSDTLIYQYKEKWVHYDIIQNQITRVVSWNMGEEKIIPGEIKKSKDNIIFLKKYSNKLWKYDITRGTTKQIFDDDHVYKYITPNINMIDIMSNGSIIYICPLYNVTGPDHQPSLIIHDTNGTPISKLRYVRNTDVIEHIHVFTEESDKILVVKPYLVEIWKKSGEFTKGLAKSAK